MSDDHDTTKVGGAGDPRVPPLHVSGPDGRRVTVAIDSAARTVGELADALGVPRAARLFVDGRPVDRRLRLDRAGIGEGSRLTCRTCGARREAPPAAGGDSAPAAHRSGGAGLAIAVEAGPAAGATIILRPGRNVAGRASGAAIRVDDGLVELHHAVLDVDGQAAALTQLTGRVPCRVSAGDGAPAEPAAAVATALAPGAVVEVGATRLRVRAAVGDRAAATLTPLPGDPWRRAIQRTPRPLATWIDRPIEPPAAAPGQLGRAPGGLLTAVLSLLGGAALALVIGNPMLMMFGAIGLVVAFGSVVSARLSDRRHRRRRAADSRHDRDRFGRDVAARREDRRAHHVATAPTIDRALATIDELDGALWSRRAGHPDAFMASLGWGDVEWDVPVAPGAELSDGAAAIVARAAVLRDVPVPVDLSAGASIAVAGRHAAAVARSLVVQLAALTGPADVRLVVVADRVDQWEWCEWLPHTATGDGGTTVVDAGDTERLAAMLTRLDDGDDRHVVLVTDRPDLLATRTGPLRRYLGTAKSVAVVAVVAVVAGGPVPALCRSVLEIGSLCTGRWCPDSSSPTAASTVHAAGVALADADRAARRLARIHDPEDPSHAAGAIPAAVRLAALLRRGGGVDDPIAVAARWRAADGRPRVVVGVTADGAVDLDLVRDGPHALIAGTTGAGKSELLRTLVASLAASCSPDDVTFVLIDYKGGSTFDACSELPHTVGVVTDLDDRLAERALVSLDAELRRRERLLRATGADDLDAYRAAGPPDHPLPRLVVVVDEFAALAGELPGFLSALVGIAQRGRSLGIHLVLATQRPAGVVSDEIRANTNLRIALRLQDRADALDIVGDSAPASFPRGVPGRAMIRFGPGESVVFQTARCSGAHQPVEGAGVRVAGDQLAAFTEPGAADGHPPARQLPTELEALTRAIRGAASLCGIRPPFRPWLEPLPAVLDPGDAVDGGGNAAVGCVDDPAGQAQYALRWERGAGNLALIGALGSGTTTALCSLLVAGAPGTHAYVLDARGDDRLARLGALPGFAGVVGVHDAERRGRLIAILGDELDARRTGGTDALRAPVVLAIDGLSTVLAALSGPATVDEHDRLLRVLADGPGVGIHAVATFERPGGVGASVLATFAQRWLFHLDDPVEAGMLAVNAAHVPPAIPGRILVTESRLEAQLAVLAVTAEPDSGAHEGIEAPVPIGTLADDIDGAGLPPSTAGEGSTSLAVGIEFHTLRPAALHVHDGEHVLIAGPARSGRTTALARSIAAWRSAHPRGLVVVHCPRRGSALPVWVKRRPGAVLAADEAAIAGTARDAGDRRRVLVAVDDAERVDDAAGALLGLVNERDPNVMVVAAGRPDALRTMYGHWTAVVRRSRTGLVMTTGGDLDGEMFGEPLPRRTPIRPRPGLAWMFDSNGRRLVQIGRDL